MTSTNHPRLPGYSDEAEVRGELSRVFDVCRGCRKCTDLCDSFPALFGFIDALAEPDAGLLTPDQQDRVGDGCHQCGMCVLGCPHAPGRDDRAIDFPGAMRRLAAMRRATGQVSLRRRWATRIIGNTTLVGAVATTVAPVVNRVLGRPAGSTVRKAVSALTGVSAVRVLPPFARQRFSTWFTAFVSARAGDSPRAMRRSVTVYPTCVVEYQEPGIGRDLVRVLEHNGIGCTVAGASRCCGAPYLHAGDLAAFARAAGTLVKVLASAEGPIVVPQPTCASVMRNDYPVHLEGAEAALVAGRVVDPCEYLTGLGSGEMKTGFDGDVPGSIVYHLPCHARTAGSHTAAADLLSLTGARVTVVDRCAGIGGLWGMIAERDAPGEAAGRALGAEVAAAGGDALVGGCHLANTVIGEHVGPAPRHPIQVLARAYGLPDD